MSSSFGDHGTTFAGPDLAVLGFSNTGDVVTGSVASVSVFSATDTGSAITADAVIRSVMPNIFFSDITL